MQDSGGKGVHPYLMMVTKRHR